MKLDILEKKENPLFNRLEVSALATFQGQTPKKDDIKDAVAKSIKPEGVTVVKKIDTAFGTSKAKVSAFIYNDEESAKKYEPPVKQRAEKAPKQEEKKE